VRQLRREFGAVAAFMHGVTPDGIQIRLAPAGHISTDDLALDDPGDGGPVTETKLTEAQAEYVDPLGATWV
jgi:hypothetical protein